MMLTLVLLFFYSSGPYWINAYNIGDCGIRYTHYTPAISYGSTSKQNEFPWHVALFRLNKNFGFDYICGGSIIDINVVLTAAHCVFDDKKKDIDYSRMVVIAGKHNASWEHWDVHEQRFDVINSRIPEKYRGEENRLQDDIALLTLNDSIKFSSIVMPVCIDWNGKFEPYENEVGTIVGWGLNEKKVLSELLQVAEMQQRNFGECRNSVGKGFTHFLTSDKFCAINLNKSMLEQGDSGGGLVFTRDFTENQTQPTFFVKGVLSAREQGNKKHTIFTNISDHMSWIQSTRKTIIAETEARKVCGLRYPQNSTNEIIRYEEYPWLATIYMMKNNKFFGIRCVGTIIHERAILTKSMLEQGDSGGGLVFTRDFTENQTQPTFFVKGVHSAREQGNKKHTIFTNISDHMSWIQSTRKTIIAETEARKGYWCIHDTRPHYKGVEYRILVGKNELSMREDEETQQDFSISKPYLQKNYVDWISRAENEMVILIVDNKINFSKSVAPICIDTARQLSIKNSSVGMIATWDLDECHCQVMSEYRYLNIDDCAQAFRDSEEYQRYVTSEKVCGRHVNGTHFLYGSDIGTGYFFLKNGTNRHYLQGVVSKGRPTDQDFLIFTNVELNLRWINDILLTIYNTGSGRD